MGTPVFTPDGQPVDVDANEATRGFVEGRYRLPSGRIAVRFADGGVGTVDAAEAQQVVDGGGGLATTEELTQAREARRYNEAGEQARAGLEGAARGLSFGGVDAAARVLGGDELADEMRLRRQYNPGTALAGEVVGAFAPMLIPGAGEANAARIVGEGAALAREASTLARVGEGAASAARVVGAPVRAVARLGDAGATGGRLAAEALGIEGSSVLGRVGARALEEGGRGVVEGAVQGLGGAVSEVALGETPDIRADRILAHVGMGALLGGSASGVLGAGGRLAREAVGGAGDLLRPLGTQLRREANQARLEASGVWGRRALQQVEHRAGGVQGFADELDRLRIGQGERGVLPNAARSLDDAELVLERAGAKFDDAVRQIDDAAESAAASTGLRDAAESALRPGRVDVRPMLARVDELAAELRRAPSGGDRLARALEKQVEPLRAAGTTGLAFKDAWQQRKTWDALVRNWGMPGSPLRPADQLKTLRGLMSEGMDSAADRAGPGVGDVWRAANREFSVARQVLDSAGMQRLSSIGGIGGAVGTAMELATGGGLNPMAMARGVVDRIGAQQVRVIAPALKARAFKFLADAAQGTTKRVDAASRGIVAATVARAARAIKSGTPRATVEAYESAVRDVRETTPETMVRRIGEGSAGLAELAPDTHAAVTARAMAAQQFLVQRVPASDAIRPGDMQPHLRRSRPVSESDRAKFLALKAAVDDPSIVLDAIEDKSVTPDQVAVLREVYPALYQEVRNGVMRAIAESPDQLDYESRLRLGILLDAPTDPTLAPGVVAMLQASYQVTPPASPTSTPSQPQRRASSALAASEVDAFESRRLRPVG